jgi:hypothetical protein
MDQQHGPAQFNRLFICLGLLIAILYGYTIFPEWYTYEGAREAAISVVVVISAIVVMWASDLP